MAAHVPSRLYRSRSQKMIAGVSGGLGDYFDVDPVLIRLLFVVTAFISGVGILAYIVLWIVVPFEGDDGPRLDSLRRDFDDLSGRVREYVDPGRMGGRAPAEPAEPSAAGSGPAGGAAAGAAPEGRSTATGAEGSRWSGSALAAEPPSAAPGPAPASAGPGPDPLRAEAPFPADAPLAADAPPDDAVRRRTIPYEDVPMTPESATSSRLPARYEPAGAAAIDPLDEPLPPAPPRISSSAPLPPDDPFADADVGPASPRSGPSADPVGAGPRGSRAARSDDDLPYVAPSFVAAAPPERRRRRQHWAGAILIVLGLLILGNNLGLLWWVEPEYILPLILVGAGAWLLFGRGRRG